MEILTRVAEMKERAREIVREGSSIGVVPTMGYLHDGHMSLIRRARRENEVCVATIFVNPTQFGPNEDLDKYPRDPDADRAKCMEAGVDFLFTPSPEDIYPPGYQTYVTVEDLSGPLCGASRPTHFRGVATIVLKLFNICLATRAYFGLKDYQQFQVIRTMARDLNLETQVIGLPTVRESDGLAMSSRNAYLSPDQRKQALCLNEALEEASALMKSGEKDPRKYLTAMEDRIIREPQARIDYLNLVDPESLEELKEVNGRGLAAIAVFIGATRLIDNRILSP
jgi:pantoate--beta-alanine ligase